MNKELASFVESWREQPRNHRGRVVEEMASLVHETRNIPDPGEFEILSGKFYQRDRKTGGLYLVEDYIDRTTEMGKRDAKAFGIIQDWAAGDGDGIAVWFSPPHKDPYFGEICPEAKVMVHENEVKDGRRKHTFRAYLLGNKDLVASANELSVISTTPDANFTDPEELRAQPLIFEGVNSLWAAKQIIGDPKQWRMVESGEDWEEKEKNLKDADDFYDSHILRNSPKSGTKVLPLGGGGASCRAIGRKSRAFEVMAGSTPLLEKTFNCPKCGGAIESGKGIEVCPHEGCGAKKSDYGNLCD
jgi:hypothetical protein